MSGPPAGTGRQSALSNGDCRGTYRLWESTRRLRTLCLLGKDEEHGGGGYQQEKEIDVRGWYKRAVHQERVQRELGHLGVARDVSVVRMVAPPPPEPSERQERADDHPHVECEAE